MATYRLTQSFSAGLFSPLMGARVDFARYPNSCKQLHNMISLAQGPAARRPGMRFIYDMTAVSMSLIDPKIRLVPFIFNEEQAYALIFFKHIDGLIHLVFGDQNGLIVYPSPPPTECPSGTPSNPLPVAGEVMSLSLVAGWDIKNFDYAQSGDELYITQSGLAPRVITRHDLYCWSLASITFTDAPSDWSNANGWPERVAFHQQRLAFAASSLKRQTVWLSKAGDFFDFGVSSPLIDSDAITFTLDSGTQNKIVWMVSTKTLNLGTIGNEWTVSGSTRAALTPSNVLAQRQTSRGGEQNKPLLIDSALLFLERHGRVLNEFIYNFSDDNFANSDISVLSSHLTDPAPIVDWTYQQSPSSIVWAIRGDGEMLGITYQRRQKIVGWHSHSTAGEFLAITSVPGDEREDEVWFAVQRPNGKIYIEKMHREFIHDSLDTSARFLDSFSEYSGVPVDSLSGLDYLEGFEVVGYVDGSAHPPMTVVNGTVQLNGFYSQVAIGLPYVSTLEPNLKDASDTSGTSIGRTQRIIDVYIDFYRTVGGYFGKTGHTDSDDTIEEIPFRVPTDLTGQPVPLTTGIIKLSFPEGFDSESNYFLQQRQPLPMTVRAVTDLVEVND